MFSFCGTENVFGSFEVFAFEYDVLNLSMRFNIRFCIYEHIQNHVVAAFFGNASFETTGVQHLFFVCLSCSCGLGTYLIV